MSDAKDYVLDSGIECERLDRQGQVQGFENVLRHFDLRPGMKILDAGSGSGWVSRNLALAHPEVEIVGADYNPDYVAYAKAKAGAAGLSNLSYEVADIQHLPFEDGAFDLVWCQFVLFFVPDAQATVNEFARVARRGGQVKVAIHQRTMLDNHPVEPEVQEDLEELVEAILSGWRVNRLPEMFRSAGLDRIDLDISTDRIYTMIGRASDDQIRNVREVLSKPIATFTDIFGSEEAGEEFLENLLAYLRRDDTSTITPYYVFTATA